MGKSYYTKVFFLAVITFLAAKLGLKFALFDDNISLVWPPTGISLAALLIFGKRLWPGVFIGALVATLSTGVSWVFAVGAAFANVIEALLGTILITKYKIRHQLDRIWDVLLFIGIAVLCTPIIAGLMGGSSFCLTHSCSASQFFMIAFQWALGNAMGALILTPLLLSWWSEVPSLSAKPVISLIGVSCLVITNLFIFGVIETPFLDANLYAVEYLSFPLLIWAGFSLRQRGASTAIFLTVIIAILGTVTDTGPFVKMQSTNAGLFRLWSFIGVVSFPTLLLAAAVEERQIAEKRLEQLATCDSLTGLPNRITLIQKIEEIFSHCQTEKQEYSCAILFIDLNRFKEINDSFGHRVGDQLLYQVAQRLENSVSQNHLVARMGGDEFSVLLSEIDNKIEAIQASEEILRQLEYPFYIEDCKFLIGATIGIAFGNHDYKNPEDLLRDADIAMYQAKVQQKKSCHFRSEMRERIKFKLKLDQQLREAIPKEELSVVYQPIIDISSSELIGFETLLRWHNAESGWVSPAHFIPLAEQTELIIELGDWVMRKACSQLKEWESLSIAAGLTLSVNLSPKQLREEGLAIQVAKIIKFYGINPQRLRLEITETAILETKARKVLEDLKALGVGLYLDDFGIGESSLTRLYQLPLDIIKIDKAFVQGIPENARKSAIAQTIITLAEKMDLGLIAEGIETEAQRKKLLEWGCPMGQGYLFSKPILAEQATDMILHQID